METWAVVTYFVINLIIFGICLYHVLKIDYEKEEDEPHLWFTICLLPFLGILMVSLVGFYIVYHLNSFKDEESNNTDNNTDV